MNKLFETAVIAFVFQASSDARELASVDTPTEYFDDTSDSKELASVDTPTEYFDDTSDARELASFDYPKDLCCYLWKDKDFNGKRLEYCLGYFENDVDIHLGDNWGSVSSWACGKKVKYRFCYWDVKRCNDYKSPSGAGAISNVYVLP